MLPEMTNFLSGRKPITCINMHDTRIVHLPASRPNLLYTFPVGGYLHQA